MFRLRILALELETEIFFGQKLTKWNCWFLNYFQQFYREKEQFRSYLINIVFKIAYIRIHRHRISFEPRQIKDGRWMRCCGSKLVSMRIRIQHFRSNADRIQGLDDPKILRVYSWNPRPPLDEGRPKLQEKLPALKRENPALQNKYISQLFLSGHFCPRFGSALPTRIRI